MADNKPRNYVLSNGSNVYGIELEFEIGKEHWNEYMLTSGARLRIKNTLIRAIQVYDKETNLPKKDDTGEPEIVVNTTIIAIVRED